MNTFADTFELPMPITIDGKEMKISPLTTRDYLPWLAELKKDFCERETRLIPQGIKAVERSDYQRRIETIEAIPADIERLIWTAEGTLRILDMALKKSGIDEATRNKFVDSQTSKANERLAARLSGLLTVAKFAEYYNVSLDKPEKTEKPDPNPQAAESAAA